MTRNRSLLVCALALALLAVSAAAAQASCSKTWVGASGVWSEAVHWSPEGAPTNTDTACITNTGTYTVTLPPNGGEAKSLIVGGASGVQSVDIAGASYAYGGETQRATSLRVASASFAANTRLILDATEGGSTQVPAEEKGASAFLIGGTIEDFGQIETVVSDPKFDDRMKVGDLVVKPGASIHVVSGTLHFLQEGEGAAPWSATNEGTITVAAGAAVAMNPSFAGNAAFTNAGTIVNDGSITGSGSNWVQASGALSGGAVVLQGGSALTDSAGTGAFLFNSSSGTITGTIPAGQTVTVQGEPYGYGGETYYSTTLSLGGKALVNDGTLLLNPTGSGELSGGSVNLEAGSIQNNGVIEEATETATRQVQDTVAITNAAAGTLEVSGGIFQQNEGAPTTNDGHITIAPGALYGLEENASLVNAGTLSPEIAGTSSFGAIQLTGPCCHGPGVFTAGGALAPVLLNGFVPAAGQEFAIFELDGGSFTGAFGAVANGFTADYAHEHSEPAFVGAVYGAGAPAGGGKPGTPVGTTVAPSPHITSISGARGRLKITLACPGGGATCGTANLLASVTEHLKKDKIRSVTAKSSPHSRVVTIASGHIALAAGQTHTLTIPLNAVGRSLLARFSKLTTLVRLTAGKRTVSTRTVVVKRPPRAKGHR